MLAAAAAGALVGFLWWNASPAKIFSYKTTGKRVFLNSPLHHHFQLKGWSEVNVVIRFWIIAGKVARSGWAASTATSWPRRADRRERSARPPERRPRNSELVRRSLVSTCGRERKRRAQSACRTGTSARPLYWFVDWLARRLMC
jgi:hypothetical protein